MSREDIPLLGNTTSENTDSYPIIRRLNNDAIEEMLEFLPLPDVLAACIALGYYPSRSLRLHHLKTMSNFKLIIPSSFVASFVKNVLPFFMTAATRYSVYDLSSTEHHFKIPIGVKEQYLKKNSQILKKELTTTQYIFMKKNIFLFFLMLSLYLSIAASLYYFIMHFAKINIKNNLFIKIVFLTASLAVYLVIFAVTISATLYNIKNREKTPELPDGKHLISIAKLMVRFSYGENKSSGTTTPAELPSSNPDRNFPSMPQRVSV